MGNHCIRAIPAVNSLSTSEQINNFIASIRPFDLIVFQGGEGISTLISALEKHVTGLGDISHVEVAINKEWCNNINVTSNSMLSWGSTLSGNLNDGVLNAETGGVTFGIQLRVLEDEIYSYLKNPKANIGVCSLLNNPILQGENETTTDYNIRAGLLREKINYIYTRYNGKYYNPNPISLFSALFPRMHGIRKINNLVMRKLIRIKTQYFCSEWAAVLYKEIGVITDETDGIIDGKILNPSDIIPVDFIGALRENCIIRPICKLPPVWLKDN